MDTGSKKIARVFPRRTSATPHDELAFVGAITMETIAAIARAEPSEIHISATFTWDLPDVDELYESYSVFGVPVEVGGPAFGDRMGDFVPGMYIREGLVFTSRGCNKNCWFCSVPKCCNGEIRELPIVDGWNILDDNVLATSMEHFRGVCNMLMRQPERAVFSGGLEPSLLTAEHARLLAAVRPKRIYTAYDTKDDLEPLREMGRLLREAGITEQSNALACYVLVGYEGDTLESAEERCREAMEAGAMPFAMLYRDESGRAPDKEWRRFQREWANRIIVGRKLKDYRNARGRTEQEDRQ